MLIAFVYVMHSDQLYIGNTGVAFLWLTFDFNLFYDSSQFRMSKIFVPQQIQLLNIHSLSQTDNVVPRSFKPNPFVYRSVPNPISNMDFQFCAILAFLPVGKYFFNFAKLSYFWGVVFFFMQVTIKKLID